MRPVNLLPPAYRPRQRRGRGGGYLVIAVLGALLVASLLYVRAANQVTSRTDAAAKLRGQAQSLEARAAALRPYAAFADLKRTRVDSVRTLAVGRFDWERLVRETARVLPRGVWLTGAEAKLNPDEGTSASGGSSSTGSTGSSGSSGQLAGPGMTLSGCARGQRDVATTMVRLRSVHFAGDVQLTRSSRPESGGSGATSGGSAGADGCGESRGRPNLSFEVSMLFSPDTLAGGLDRGPGRVPASLGGGA